MGSLDYLIITPTYKRDHLLVENISSVQRQDYHSYLQIVVDDDNSQKTAELISLIGDRRIIYLPRIRSSQDLKTCSNAINYALRYVISRNYRFKYLKILHDDDMLYKDVLKRHAQYLSNDDIGMVHGREIRWNQDENNYEIKGIGFSSNPKLLKLKNLANYIQYTTVSYRYDEFIKIKLKDGSWYKSHMCFGEDKDVVARYLSLISKNSYKVRFDNNICSVYGKSGHDRITNNTEFKKIRADIKEVIKSNSTFWERFIIRVIDYLEYPSHIIPKKIRDGNKYAMRLNELLSHKRLPVKEKRVIYWWL